jgi:hypothetical protein
MKGQVPNLPLHSCHKVQIHIVIYLRCLIKGKLPYHILGPQPPPREGHATLDEHVLNPE